MSLVNTSPGLSAEDAVTTSPVPPVNVTDAPCSLVRAHSCKRCSSSGFGCQCRGRINCRVSGEGRGMWGSPTSVRTRNQRVQVPGPMVPCVHFVSPLLSSGVLRLGTVVV